MNVKHVALDLIIASVHTACLDFSGQYFPAEMQWRVSNKKTCVQKD